MARGRDEEQAGESAGKSGVLAHVVRVLAAGLVTLSLAILVLIYHVAPLPGALLPTAPLPSVLLRNAEAAFAEAGFELTPAVSENARTAALNAPLEAKSFYYAAMGLDEAREPDRILALLDETLKRDPRHYYARLWRARLYHRANRIPDAVQEIVRVFSLDHDNSAEYIDALVDLARNPESHPLFLTLVEDRPPWSEAFVRRANEVLTDDEFFLALTSRSKTAFNDYVGALANQGDFERAFLIWQSSLTQAELLAFSWPYDASFKLKEGSSVFGWRTTSPMATREQNGLYVYFDGRGEEKMAAAQTIMLGQGYAYTLVVSMSGDIRSRGGSFRWRIRCLESGDVVAELDVLSLEAVPNSYSADFYIPEDGCPVQNISIVARPGDYTDPARVTVHNVTIREKPLDDSTTPRPADESDEPEATRSKTSPRQ